MVKAYLRYELAGTFGVVNSDANVVCNGNYIVSAALENIVIWNARLGTQVLRRFGEAPCVLQQQPWQTNIPSTHCLAQKIAPYNP